MLNAFSSIQLASTPLQTGFGSTLALILCVTALLIALAAYAKARRATAIHQAAQAIKSVKAEATTAAAAISGGFAQQSAVGDDRQLVAVITAAISAILTSEAGLSAKSRSYATGSASATAIASATASAGAKSSSGPYAGFVVRRIRRV